MNVRHPFPPQGRPPQQSPDHVINFVMFVSRDGLMAQMPCGKPRSSLTNRAYRVLKSGLLNVRDEAVEMPKPADPDFRDRSREYTFEHIDVQPETGITTAVYVETLSAGG